MYEGQYYDRLALVEWEDQLENEYQRKMEDEIVEYEVAKEEPTSGELFVSDFMKRVHESAEYKLGVLFGMSELMSVVAERGEYGSELGQTLRTVHMGYVNKIIEERCNG